MNEISFYLMFIISLLFQSFGMSLDHIPEFDDITQFNQTSLINAAKRSHICTLVVVGATWDGHFKHWIRYGNWKLLNQLFKKNADEISIEMGYFLYNVESLPQITSDAWPSITIGSYDVVMFKNGKALERNRINELLRPSQKYREFNEDELIKIIQNICVGKENEDKGEEGGLEKEF